MTPEAGFLAALEETPDDGVTRLAYADWLEERGDARAELLRLEEAQRVGDPTTARHWSLQATLDPAWVVRVSRSAPLAELRVLVPPPRRPNRPEGSWAAVEAAIGLRLPEDYKAFLDVYGVGAFNHCLDVHHPFHVSREGYREDWVAFAGYYEGWREFREIPYPIFPEASGLLPFGLLGDVHALGWLTEGEPHAWPFVYHGREAGFAQLAGQSGVEAVLEIVTGRSPMLYRLGDRGLEPPVMFRPYWTDGGEIRLMHPEAVEIEALASQVAARWPVEDARVEHSESGVSIHADPLQGRVRLYRAGDPRTWLHIRYGPEGAALAAEIEADMRAAGFRDLG